MARAVVEYSPNKTTGLFVFVLLSCKSSLRIAAPIPYVFFQSLACVFIFLLVSSAVQKMLLLMKFNLAFFLVLGCLTIEPHP